MRRAVMCMGFNNLDLTQKAVDSLQIQDIGPLAIFLVNNGSTDGTLDYFMSLKPYYPENRILVMSREKNVSPVALTNSVLFTIFSEYKSVLCIANDVVLPFNAYRLMDQWPRGIITASQTTDENFPRVESTQAVSENTPMCAVLLRKWVHDAVISKHGYYFDENFFNYASDCDLALRIAACGIRGVQLDMPFYHYGSATLKLTTDVERRKSEIQADEDRAYFVRKWGFHVFDAEYSARAVDLNFKGVR